MSNYYAVFHQQKSVHFAHYTEIKKAYKKKIKIIFIPCKKLIGDFKCINLVIIPKFHAMILQKQNIIDVRKIWGKVDSIFD